MRRHVDALIEISFRSEIKGAACQRESHAVPEQGEQQRRNEDDPESRQPLSQVAPPAPRTGLDLSQYRPADKIPAQYEENDHGCVTVVADEIERPARQPHTDTRPVVDEHQVAQMA